jgi:ketol-acid reductoisomerase
MVAPKGMGPSVRKLYLQGLKVEGAGINSSVAVQVTNPERYRLVQDVANAWSVGIGSPVTFGTGFLREVTSDLFGERSMLLGGLYGMAVALDGFYRDSCHLDPSMAFRMASSGITGTVTDRLSACGIAGFRRSLSTSQTVKFDKGYVLGYPVFDGVMNDIYQQVSSFEEISMVVEATRGLAEHPMSNIESDSSMWNHAREHSLYGERVMMSDMLAFSAGIYVSGLMAQLQTLLHHGHKVSEVVNESFIEAVDSLTPYMDSRGGGFMVDNCSTTARLGTRLWAPVFRRRLSNVLVSQTERSNDEYARVLQTFADEPLHHDIGLCMGCRPSVRISVPLQN